MITQGLDTKSVRTTTATTAKTKNVSINLTGAIQCGGIVHYGKVVIDMRLIDADALTDEVMERYCKECDKRKGIKNGKYRIVYEIGDAPCRACPLDDVKDELDNAPAIEERKTGKWIPLQLSMAHPPYQCSCCFRNAPMVETGCLVNRHLEALLTDWCPWCGAKMKEGEQA